MNKLVAFLSLFAGCMALGQIAATTGILPKLRSLSPALSVGSATDGPAIAKIFSAAVANLDTQFLPSADGTVYVSTGDIHAEWLRDSSVQTRPFLLFAKTNSPAARLVKGVITRQAKNLLIDSYANAFYEDYTVHERKYELDSLVNPILLAWTYWKVTDDDSVFSAEVWRAMKLALKTMRTEQDHNNSSTYTHPRLSGNRVAKTGLIWSGFRPSDDRCEYNYNIPSNAMAAQSLFALSEIASSVMNDVATASDAKIFEKQLRESIAKFGIATTGDGAVVYAYEVDGLGHALVMDDANLPNLISLPYYGFLDADDALYLRTRARILSHKNPFYFSGSRLSGVGSPHTPRDMVWPLALIVQTITSTLQTDFDLSISNLINSDFGNTGLHESVNVDDPSKYTRSDFGWPNAMFVEMALNRWNGFAPLPKVSVEK